MKYIYIIIFLLAQGVSYSGEDTTVINFYGRLDSVMSRIDYNFAGIDDKLWVDSLTYFDNYDSVNNFVSRKNANGPLNMNNINFTDSVLILVTYSGVDCHSRFNIKMLDDAGNREYKFIIKVIYGGCRAGGKSYTRWLLIPKPPEGYKITYHSYFVDRNWWEHYK